jgi:DNA-binding transcriptional regulator YiaG
MDTAKRTRARRLAGSGAAKSIRVAAGVSLPEVAHELEVAISTVWRWENGQRVPKGDASERYADLLDRLVAS